jgi:hypothetical protein
MVFDGATAVPWLDGDPCMAWAQEERQHWRCCSEPVEVSATGCTHPIETGAFVSYFNRNLV